MGHDPKMFEICGLADVSVYQYAYTLNHSDHKLPFDYRREHLISEIEDEIQWLESRYTAKREIYAEHGFDNNSFRRLIELLNIKLKYVRDHFEIDKSFEWLGGFNFIVTGMKKSI